MRWIKNASDSLGDFCHSEPRITNPPCHSEPGAKPGEEPAFQPAPQTRILKLLSLLLVLSSFAIAQAPQDLLATGHVDQALQVLNQRIQTAPTAEAYNLLCRAHFELGAWD